MNGNRQPIPTVDDLIEDPARFAVVTPQMAQSFLIGLASIQPLLIQRALMGDKNGHADMELLTVPAIAKLLKVSEYKVYELIRQGAIRKTSIGDSVRVKPSDLAAYVDRTAD